jgi:signal transduction histidine kinase
MSASAQAAAALLDSAGVAALELDDGHRLRQLHNAALLSQWCAEDAAAPLPEECPALLATLFGPRHLAQLQEALGDLRAMTAPARLELDPLPSRRLRDGAPSNHFSVALLPLDAGGCLLLLRDVTQQQGLLLQLQEARASNDAAMAALRAPPDGLRLFLGSAMASVSAIRATLRVPVRSQEALRDKLGRLRAEACALRNEAKVLDLAPLLHCCDVLIGVAEALQSSDTLRGDALLPLAPRIDAIASAIGMISRIEEQRYEPPVAEESAPRARRSAPWHEVSERRWSEFLRSRGEELGTLVRLTMSGAHQVPASHRRHVDEVLTHLLRNALDHGIETPEDRLAIGKTAAGRVTVSFSLADDRALKMTVHDDGRGFDLARIGRAAVQSGLLSEDSLIRREAGELVGLIFKPSFSTEGIEGDEGQGRGMSYLRRQVTRLGGQISVATKPGRYTLFTIELPDSAQHEEPAPVPQAMP